MDVSYTHEEIKKLIEDKILNAFLDCYKANSEEKDRLEEFQFDLLKNMGSEKMVDVINNEENNFEADITSLKKRVKYCKNPLEKKRLQQELNLAYKKQKKVK